MTAVDTILIIGTGRCGTNSAAKLLGLQPGVGGYHEPPPPLPVDPSDATETLEQRLARIRSYHPVRVVAAAAYFFLSYIEHALERMEGLRVVSLHRPLEDTAKSMARKLGAEGPWTWAGFRGGDRAADIRAYCEWYHAEQTRLLAGHPDVIHPMPVEGLSSPEAIDHMLAFCGIPAAERVIEPTWTNRDRQKRTKAEADHARRLLCTHRGGWEGATDEQILEAWDELSEETRRAYESADQHQESAPDGD